MTCLSKAVLSTEGNQGMVVVLGKSIMLYLRSEHCREWYGMG